MSNSFGLKISDIKNQTLQKLAWSCDSDDTKGYLSETEYSIFKEKALYLNGISDEDFNQAMGLYKENAKAPDETVTETTELTEPTEPTEPTQPVEQTETKTEETSVVETANKEAVKADIEENNAVKDEQNASVEDVQTIDNDEEIQNELQKATYRVVDLRKYGSGAEKIYTEVESLQAMDDGSAEGGLAGIKNGLDAMIDYYSDPKSGVDRDKAIEMVTDLENKILQLQELAKGYLRENADSAKEVLEQGKAIEITLTNGQKLYVVPKVSLRGNNNSADSVTEYVGEGEEPEKKPSGDVSKLIGGIVAAAEVYTDKWQIIAKVSFGSDDYDGTVYANFENTTENGSTVSVSGGAGLTTDKDGTNTRAGLAVDYNKDKFYANGTAYYNSQKSGDDNDWQLNFTATTGYSNKKDDDNYVKVDGGFFYERENVDDYWGGTVGCNGSKKWDNGWTVSGNFETKGGKLSFNKDAIFNLAKSYGLTDEQAAEINLNPTFYGTTKLQILGSVKADDFKFKAGALCQVDYEYDKDEEEGKKWDVGVLGAIYASVVKGRFTGTTMVNFLGNEVIPGVSLQVDNVYNGLGLKASYVGPSSYERAAKSPGTFLAGLVKSF